MMRVNLTDEPQRCRRVLAIGRCRGVTAHVSHICRRCRYEVMTFKRQVRRAERRAKRAAYPDPSA